MPIALDTPRAAETQLLTQKVNIEYVATSGQFHGLDVGDNFLRDSGWSEFDFLVDSKNDNYVYAYLGKIYRDTYLKRADNNKKSIFVRPIKNITLEEDTYLSILDLEQESLPSFFNTNIKKLSTDFNAEFSKKKQSFTVSEEEVLDMFYNLSNHIAEINFEHSAVELTDSNSLKFTLLFPEKKLLMITKSLNPSEVDLGNDDIIFSLFINRKLIASDVSEITAFTESFKKYLVM